MAKTLIVKTKEEFLKHVDKAVKEDDLSFDVYDKSKNIINKSIKNKLKKASTVEKKRTLQMFMSNKEIESKDIKEIILHYSNFNVVWRL